MRNMLLLFSALFLLIGCDKYAEVEGRVVIVTKSTRTTYLVIDGRRQGPDIAPSGAADFKADLKVGRQDNGYIQLNPTAPTANDHQVFQVQFVLYDAATKQPLTDTIYCSAGGQMTTRLSYDETKSYSYDKFNCRS